MLAASFSSVGSGFAGAAAVELEAGAGCARYALSLAFCARNVASSRAASLSCSTNFVFSPPELPLPPLRVSRWLSRSVRHELRGASAAGDFAATVSELSGRFASDDEREFELSDDDEPVEAEAVDDDVSVDSAEGALAQPASANVNPATTARGSGREVMGTSKEPRRLECKPCLRANWGRPAPQTSDTLPRYC